jgi:hypothetical protein
VDLTPLSGFDPILVNDWFCCSTTSPDGRFLAGLTGGNIENEIRLIDLADWEELHAWTEARFDGIVELNEFGTLFFTTSGPTFRQLTPGSSESQVLASLHLGMGIWGSGNGGEGRYVFFGTRTPASQDALLNIVDTNTGRADAEVREIDLPGVHIGPVEPETALPWSDYFYSEPSFNVDPVHGRGLVVHGDADVVSSVDLMTGEVTDHTFTGGSVAPASIGVQRSSTISPDGGFLYVSTRGVNLIGDEADWTVTTIPSGVVKIDTTSWETVAATDEPITDDLHLSPDGNRIIASGYITEENDAGVHKGESTGTFILDATNLSTVAHYLDNQFN